MYIKTVRKSQKLTINKLYIIVHKGAISMFHFVFHTFFSLFIKIIIITRRRFKVSQVLTVLN